MRYFISIILGLVLLTPTGVGYAQERSPAYTVLDIEVGQYSTHFKTSGKRNRNRAHNVRRTMILAGRIVLMPKEVFSYNERIGERTKEAGFKPAGAIRGGKIVSEYGGGVCQLAGTLHAAALYAGLDIVEWHRHSRASTYIRPGLDATVSWDEKKDLKFKNNYDVPIFIEITEPDFGKLTVKIFAHHKVYEVRIRFIEKKVIPFDTLYLLKWDKPCEYKKVLHEGTKGYHIWRIRNRRLLRGSYALDDPEKQFAYYPPVPRLVEVGFGDCRDED